YTFDNLEGWKDFSKKAEPGDIVITGKNFGAGSSRQQAVDCFKSLGVQIIIAESFGSIYERNAINAAFPILSYDNISELNLQQRDKISIDLETSILTNLETGKSVKINDFSSVQVDIYKKGGLLK
ncbi:MAG: homoaconitate hydratase, partial [Candidatus Delongbacteria bacterium]|nr:homoaconitate hydratase [Candidatus Delongbacteria bacterium]